MKTKKIVAGALVGATLLAGAASAQAADVTVRVEGSDRTLVPRTPVSTTSTPVSKDGTHSCPGTTAAGALELATGGDWNGTWSDSFGYSVDVVKGEEHRFFSGQYWTFYVGYVAQETGVCGRELTQGEEVVFAPQSEDPDKGHGLLRLQGVPERLAPGQSVTVQVTRTTNSYDSSFKLNTETNPAAGATVSGNGVSYKTDAEGRVSFIPPQRGELDLRATRDGDVRSATERLCVTDGSDGACGTTPPVTVCRTTGADGFCGTPDRRAAFGVITAIKEQQRFARGQGPRELAGRVEADASGVESVRLRLVRNDRKRCSRFDDARLEFRRTRRCRTTAGKWFTVGSTSEWKYLLPERLERGRYVLDVEVRDKAGNVNRTWQRGRNRVAFHVG